MPEVVPRFSTAAMTRAVRRAFDPFANTEWGDLVSIRIGDTAPRNEPA